MPNFRTVHHVVTLTDAQIKALPTTPVAVVASGGAGKVLVPVGATYRANFAAGAYTNVNPAVAMTMQFAASPDPVFGRSLFFPNAGRWSHGAVGFIKRRDIVDQATADIGFALLAFANTGLTLALDNDSDGNLTGGHANNSLIVDTRYIVLDVPAVLRIVTGEWVVDSDPTGDPPDGYLLTSDAGTTLTINTTAERGLALAITAGVAETFYP